MDQQDKQDKQVFDLIAEVENEQNRGESNLITLSSGVVLKTKAVPPMILAKIDQKFPEPKIPHVYDEDRGRNIPNPEDPDYLAAIRQNGEARGTAVIDVIAGLGTVAYFVPTHMFTHEDDGWIDDLEFFGFDIPVKGMGRYLAWLKYYVIKSGEDLALIATKSAKSLGVPEKEVAQAIQNFQSQPERDTDTRDNA